MWSIEEIRATDMVKLHDLPMFCAGKKGVVLNIEDLNAVECISYASGLFSAAGVYHERENYMNVLYLEADKEHVQAVARILDDLDVNYSVHDGRLDVDNDADNLIRFHRHILPLDDMSKLVIASPYHMEGVRYEKKKHVVGCRRATASVT